jgi:homocitrate synthase NifV
LRNERTFEPISPEEVGLERRIVLGKHSGSHAVEAVLRERGVQVDAARAQKLLALVRAEAARRKRAVTPAELEELNAQLP